MYEDLPKAQVQPSQLPVQISYFLQNCKKGKPDEMDLPLLEKGSSDQFR
jgi:hypothetical protein